MAGWGSCATPHSPMMTEPMGNGVQHTEPPQSRGIDFFNGLSHYRTFRLAVTGDRKTLSIRHCIFTTTGISAYTMAELKGYLVRRSDCVFCERTRLWSRAMTTLTVPPTETMETAWACPAVRLSGLIHLLGGDDSKRSYEHPREYIELSELAS